MKKITVWIMAMIALCGGMLHAQDLAGTWQGTLHTGRDFRIVLKVSKADAGWKAMYYNIDAGPQGFPSTSMALNGSSLKMEILSIGMIYEAKLSPDASSMSGAVTAGGKSFPLDLARVNEQTAWAIPEPPARVPAMAANADPSFEVATIKPSGPNSQGIGFIPQGRTFKSMQTTMINLISWAYGIQAKQILNAPGWFETEKYDITGVPDQEGAPSKAQWQVMLQRLLADRFKLTLKHDRKELSAYVLSVSKTGPKLVKSTGDPDAVAHGTFGLGAKGGIALTETNSNMTDVARFLQQVILDRPVVNHTDLDGRYEFSVAFTPDDTMMTGYAIKVPPPPDGVEMPPTLFKAFQDTLGLKLEPMKTLVEVLVVDHVEKPTAD